MPRLLANIKEEERAGRPDLALLEPVRDYKARHASTLLTFDAVVSALDQIEVPSDSKRAQAAE